MGVLSYWRPKKDGDIIYSIDMVRLGFHIGQNVYDSFCKMWDKLSFRFNCEYYHGSLRIGKYNHLFALSDYKNSNGGINNFVVGLDLCEANRTHSFNCFIEFNPNKNDMGFVMWLLEIFKQFIVPVGGEYFHVKRFDLAVDVPCKRSEVMLVKSGKRTYTRMITDSVTEYLGRHNSNGFTKVYDKTVESNLDYDLTRIEITCDSLTEFSLPDVYIVHDDDMNLAGLNDTDTVIVSMLRQFEHDEQLSYLKAMGRKKQEKIKPYLYPDEKKYKFDMSLISWLVMDLAELQTVGHGYGRLFITDEEYEDMIIARCRILTIDDFEKKEQEILKEYAADEESCKKLQDELWEEYRIIRGQWELEDQQREFEKQRQKQKENKIVEEKKDDETYKQYTLFAE